MAIFEMSVVQVPLNIIVGLLNGVKLFFVSMIRDPTQEAAGNTRDEQQQ
tara:strand:+ start:430 stop:576 length:147 start_codon:yes stop_codon:yes gene_type:complete